MNRFFILLTIMLSSTLSGTLCGQVLIKFSLDVQDPNVRLEGMDCRYEYVKDDSFSNLQVISPKEGEGFLKLSYTDTTYFPECIIGMGKKINLQYTDGYRFGRWRILHADDEKSFSLMQVVEMNFYKGNSLIFADRIRGPIENQRDSQMEWMGSFLNAKNGDLNPQNQMFDSVELLFKFQFEEKKPFVFYLDDVQLELFQIAGVEEARTNKLNVYPNPCKDQLNILSETIWNKAELFDLNGRLVKTFGPDHMLPDEGLDVSELPAGMFVLQLQLQDGSQARARVVKSK